MHLFHDFLPNLRWCSAEPFCSMENLLGGTVEVTGFIQTETFTEREVVLTQGLKCPLSASEYFGISRCNRVTIIVVVVVVVVVVVIIIIIIIIMYEKRETRYSQNKMFKEDTKKFHRNLCMKNIEAREPPL